MRKLCIITALLVMFLYSVFHVPTVFASSLQAHQDYLFQYDTYRTAFTNFQVAKNEYIKFKSLTAQTDALDKTKLMLVQRDKLLRSYLSLLNEKLNEDQGLSGSTKQLYQTLIKNEITFLDGHANKLPSVGSLSDAITVSGELDSHYKILQISIRQILIGLSLGQLSILANSYDKTLLDIQKIISTYGNTFPASKQETINRWVLQIKSKRSLYQQKYDALTQGNSQLTANDMQDLDQKYALLTKQAGEARQYLAEGSSFFIELTNTLKFIE
jgi:hypothetical protein